MILSGRTNLLARIGSLSVEQRLLPLGRRAIRLRGILNKVAFSAVWGSLLGLAFLVAVNPVLLAVILLMISRPRPVQNLLAYWVGGLIVNLAFLLIPLMVLHLIPTFSAFSEEMTVPATSASSTVRLIQIGMGVLMLSIAAVMAVRSLIRRHAHLPTSGRDASVLVLNSDTPSATSPLGPLGTAAAEGGSAIRRLLARLQNAWDNGSLWVAFVFGLLGLYATPGGVICRHHHRGLGSRARHANLRRHRVRHRNVCGRRDRPPQLSDRAGENSSDTATAARLGASSASTGLDSDLCDDWALYRGKRHRHRLSRPESCDQIAIHDDNVGPPSILRP